MRPVILTRTLSAADPDAIALDQTTAGAGDLLLNGVLAETIQNTFGSVTQVPLTPSRQVTLTSAANLSGINFTITGIVAGGARTVSETIAGPNIATINTVRDDWEVITQISADAAVGSNVSVGINTVGASPPIPLDQNMTSPFNVSLSVVITGTKNVTGQYTFDDVYAEDNPGPYTWFNHLISQH